jgi:hypothetical protein
MSGKAQVFHGQGINMSIADGELKSNSDYKTRMRKRVAEIQKAKKEHAAWIKSRGKKLGVK